MRLRQQHPRYNIVSMRISDVEWDALNGMAKGTGKNISQIMRDALIKYIAAQELDTAFQAGHNNRQQTQGE